MKNFKANKILIKWKCGIFLKLKCYGIETSYAVLIQYRIIETKIILYYIVLVLVLIFIIILNYCIIPFIIIFINNIIFLYQFYLFRWQFIFFHFIHPLLIEVEFYCFCGRRELTEFSLNFLWYNFNIKF